MFLINELVEFNPDKKSLANRQTGQVLFLQLPATLCFLYLITHPGEVVSQNVLMKAGWGERNDVTTPNTFYQTILTLRNALEEVGLPRNTVKTISRRGLMLEELTTVETITASAVDSATSSAVAPATMVASEPVQTGEVILASYPRKGNSRWIWAGVFIFSLVTVINCGLLYQARLTLPFNDYVPVSLRIQADKPCKIFYAPNELFLDNYFGLISQNPELCLSNHTIFLSGYSKAERIVAFVCDKDARKEKAAFCSTYFYWMRKP
ncbi:winged helix-turn-helix domain-containing protein [Kosakonia sp. BK9b]